PSSPASSIVPRCCGNGRRASQCQAAATAAVASPVPAAPASSPARAARLLLKRLIASVYHVWPAGQSAPVSAYRTPEQTRAPLLAEIARQALLFLQLFEVGLHRHRRHRQQLDRDVVPDLGEQGGAGALAALEPGEQAALAHLAVLDVLGQLRR